MLGPLDFLDGLFGEVTEALGWTWDKVIAGVYVWLAKGVLMLMEWVFAQIDSATTPRVTDDWFASGLVREIALVGVGITTVMMLISAVQMGIAGRPELFGDAIRNGAKSILGAATAVVLIDAGLQAGDALSDTIWAAGRADILTLMDGSASAMTVGAETIGLTFLGPFLVLMGLIGFLMITSILFFRSVMIYLVAAFAPIPLALSTGPSFRGATRRLVSLTLALILAKPAITLTLVVGAKLTANADNGAGTAEGLGALVSGFMVFLVAAFAPVVVFRLLPLVGDATMTSGVMAGMGRTAMTVAQAGMIASSAGSAAGGSAATRPVGGQAGSSGAGAGPGAAGGSGGGGAADSRTALATLPIAGAGTNAALGGAASGSAAPSTTSGASPANQSVGGSTQPDTSATSGNQQSGISGGSQPGPDPGLGADGWGEQ